MKDANSHIEELLKLARRGSSEEVAPAVCDVSEERLAQLYETAKYDDASAHCTQCEERVAILRSTDGEMILPDLVERGKLMKAARELFDKERADLLTVAVRWVRGVIEVLKGDDALVPATAVAMRSLAVESTADPVSFRKRFEELDLVVHLAPRGGARFDILIDPAAAVAGVASIATHRFTLFRGAKELYSELTRGDRVRFADVPPGTYSVSVDSGGTFVGQIALNLS